MSPTQKMAVWSIATSCATLTLKFAAWYISGSVSLFSDAMESFVNLAAAIVALIVLIIAERPADKNHPFGHAKAEYFSSGLEGALILVAAISIAWAALQRLLHPAVPEQLGLGIAISLIASGLNAAMAFALLRQARKYDSIVLEADAHHLLTDVWTSAGIAIGLLVIILVPEWSILDPIIAIVVAVNIVRTGLSLLRRSADGLMDASLPAKEIEDIEQAITALLPQRGSYTGLRTRKSGARRHVEFNLLLPGDTPLNESHALCDQLEKAIETAVGRSETLIHVEPQP